MLTQQFFDSLQYDLIVPAILNSLGPDPEAEAPLAWEREERRFDAVISNSFAFGGLNSALIARRV